MALAAAQDLMSACVYIGHFYKEGILQVLFPSSWSPEMLCNTWISVDYICSHMCHLCDPQ